MEANSNTLDLTAAVNLFLSLWNEKFAAHFVKHYDRLCGRVLTDGSGSKFQRIITERGFVNQETGAHEYSGSSNSAQGFIALEDGNSKALGYYRRGDIFIAASFKVPGKNVRGSVFSTTNGLESLNSDGTAIRYLRG